MLFGMAHSVIHLALASDSPCRGDFQGGRCQHLPQLSHAFRGAGLGFLVILVSVVGLAIIIK